MGIAARRWEVGLCVQNTKDHKELIKGIDLIYAQFHSVLEEEGLKPIQAENKEFNPHYHEALLTEESKKEPNTILEELQKGYMLKHHVLRHSKVKVARKKKGTPVKD